MGEVNASCPFSLSNHACGHMCDEESNGMTTWPGGSEPPNSKSHRDHFLAFWFPQYLATTRHHYMAHRLCHQEPEGKPQGMSCWPSSGPYWPLCFLESVPGNSSMVAPNFGASTRETEADGPDIHKHLWLQNKCKTSLGYVRTSLGYTRPFHIINEDSGEL